MIAKAPGSGSDGRNIGRAAARGFRKITGRGGVDNELLKEGASAVTRTTDATKNIVAEAVQTPGGVSAAATAGTAAVLGAGAIAGAAAGSAVAGQGHPDAPDAVSRLQNIEMKGGMALMGAQFAPSVLGWMGSASQAVGRKLNIGGLGKFGGWLKTPASYMEKSIGETGAGKLIGKMTPVFDRTGQAVNWIGDKTGMNGRLISWHSGRADYRFNQAKNIAGEIGNSKVPPALKKHVDGMLKTLHKADSHGAFHKAGEDAAHSLAETYAIGKTGLEKALEGKSSLAKDAKPLMKKIGKLEKNLAASAEHGAKAGFYGDVRGGFKKMPGNVSKMSVSHGVMIGGMATLSAVSAAKDTAALARNIKGLKRMYADMTGTKVENVSMSTVLFSINAPEAVKQARGWMISTYGLQQIAELVGLGINVKSTSMIKAIVSLGAVQFVSSLIKKNMGPTQTPYFYADWSDRYKAGTLQVADYANIISCSNKEMEKRVDPQQGALADPLIAAVAEQYAAEKTNPAAILIEMTNHKFDERLRKVIDANEVNAPQAQTASHVDKLQGAPQAAMPVVGEHTAKVSAQAQNTIEQGRAV